MSFFSPITKRSSSIRSLLSAVYLLLLAGALTMVVPLIITLAGSASGVYDSESISFYPKFLFSDRALWARYLDAKYGGMIENFKMGWNDPSLDFYAVPYPPAEDPPGAVQLWDDFLKEHGPVTVREAGLGFTRATLRDAALENRQFRRWLLAQYGGDFGKLSEQLGVEARQITAVLPPFQNRIILPSSDTVFQRKFEEYLDGVPANRRLLWDVGGFYRAVYLPRIYGEDIARYNEAAASQYKTYYDVPFPAVVPSQGGTPWFRFVQNVLNPAFVELTPTGEAAQRASGLGRVDFLKTAARPEHVRIVSIDAAFAAWAERRSVPDARIPQRTMDWRNFQAEKGFWRWQFLVQNYLYVLDEVMIQGNGVRNTTILVVLSVLGALTVNPMAAYALSRFRLRQSYQILLFFLATIAFPAEVAMIPNFLLIKDLGLLNTFGALVLPGLVNGFSIFLLKGFFDSLPKELYEAADIDGANEWQIFWGFTMNLSRPILAVIALNAFVAAYSAFFFALILAPDQKMWTLMVWVYQLRQTAGPGIIYASLLITAVPTLVVYLCAQNVILRGIVVPSEK